MLNDQAASRGLNFLTPDIFQLARQRAAAGTGAVEEFRLMRNMLSSQPMAFNLFGKLALNHDLATELVRALWGAHVKRVTDVRFEWAPQPADEYLDDRTAFDVFIEYEGDGGHAGFIGIEVKLTEPFSQRSYDRPTYRRWMTPTVPGAPTRAKLLPTLNTTSYGATTCSHGRCFNTGHAATRPATCRSCFTRKTTAVAA